MHYGIIAAGEGSRLRQEGVEKPKPLVSLNGVPMIERLVRLFMEADAETISIIVNEEMKEVADFLRSLSEKIDVPLNILVKSTPSSMHSFYELSSLMSGKGRFILTTVDTIFRPESLKSYSEAFSSAPDGVDALMGITGFIEDEKPLYVATLPSEGTFEAPDPTMPIIGFFDEPAANVEFISGGVYGLNQSAIEILEDCMAQGVSRMRNFQRALIAAGLNVRGFDMGKNIDVDHAGDIKTAEEFLS